MPVDALKNTMGAAVGVGDLRSTFLATRAIFKLFSLRTNPRLMRWLKNSLFMMSPNLISKIQCQKSLLFWGSRRGFDDARVEDPLEGRAQHGES